MFQTSLSSYKTRSKKSLDIPLRKKHRKTSFNISWAKTTPRHAFPFSIKILNTSSRQPENVSVHINFMFQTSLNSFKTRPQKALDIPLRKKTQDNKLYLFLC